MGQGTSLHLYCYTVAGNSSKMDFKSYCSREDNMPPLWPHAPLWPFDPEVKRQVLQQLGPLNQGGLAEFMTHNYVQQRTLDARWSPASPT